MIPHYYHIHETSSGGQGRAGELWKLPHSSHDFVSRRNQRRGEDHMAVCYKAGSLALLLNGGGDLAHIFWTPWSKETRDGVYNVKDRLGGIRQKDNGVVWFGSVECGGG